jgi:hypothetical protein
LNFLYPSQVPFVSLSFAFIPALGAPVRGVVFNVIVGPTSDGEDDF